MMLILLSIFLLTGPGGFSPHPGFAAVSTSGNVALVSVLGNMDDRHYSVTLKVGEGHETLAFSSIPLVHSYDNFIIVSLPQKRHSVIYDGLKIVGEIAGFYPRIIRQDGGKTVIFLYPLLERVPGETSVYSYPFHQSRRTLCGIRLNPSRLTYKKTSVPFFPASKEVAIQNYNYKDFWFFGDDFLNQVNPVVFDPQGAGKLVLDLPGFVIQKDMKPFEADRIYEKKEYLAILEEFTNASRIMSAFRHGDGFLVTWVNPDGEESGVTNAMLFGDNWRRLSQPVIFDGWLFGIAKGNAYFLTFPSKAKPSALYEVPLKQVSDQFSPY